MTIIIMMMISIIFYNEEEQDDLFICVFLCNTGGREILSGRKPSCRKL